MEKSLVVVVIAIVVIGIVLLLPQFANPPIIDSNVVLDGEDEPELTEPNDEIPEPEDEIDEKFEAVVCFPTTCINAEVADSSQERAVGLMFREELGETEGMLFIFDSEATHSFWMKNTLIPLDLIWVNENMEIVHIEHAVPCTTPSCPSYTPSRPAKYVVEVNAGVVYGKGIKIGDPIILDN